ncbi:hypothetical protein D3C76_1252770 [compost metagenome]
MFCLPIDKYIIQLLVLDVAKGCDISEICNKNIASKHVYVHSVPAIRIIAKGNILLGAHSAYQLLIFFQEAAGKKRKGPKQHPNLRITGIQ